jgi:hypothetical protein
VSWLKRARRKEGARDLLRKLVLLAIKVNMFKKIIFDYIIKLISNLK